MYPKSREKVKRKRKLAETPTLYLNKNTGKQEHTSYPNAKGKPSSKGKPYGGQYYPSPKGNFYHDGGKGKYNQYKNTSWKGRDPKGNRHDKGKYGKGKGPPHGKGTKGGKTHYYTYYHGDRGQHPAYKNYNQNSSNSWHAQQNQPYHGKYSNGKKGQNKQGAHSSNPTSYKDLRCTFCNKKGHTAKDCWSLQKIQKSKSYKTLLLSTPEEQKSDIDKLIDSVGNNYCPICCDPNCPVTSDCLDPSSECAQGESDQLSQAKSILFAEESAPLLDAIKAEKQATLDSSQPDGNSEANQDNQYSQWDAHPGTDATWPQESYYSDWDHQQGAQLSENLYTESQDWGYPYYEDDQYNYYPTEHE